MSEFTLGKWEADALYGDHFAVFANEHVVADCFGNEANARLIAFAPEMYELLMNFDVDPAEQIAWLIRRHSLLARIDEKDASDE